MTTVIRRAGDREGGELPERKLEDTNEMHLSERDSEWVVDLRSRRVVRRPSPVDRQRS